MERKKIIFFSSVFPPDLGAGSFRALALANQMSLISKGRAEIHVITTHPNRYGVLENEDKVSLEKGIFLHKKRLRTHHNNSIIRILSHIKYFMYCFVKSYELKPDFYIATSSRLATALVCSLIARITKKNYYLDIRDIFSETFSAVFINNIWLKDKASTFILLIERSILRKSLGVNVVSEEFLSYFSKQGLDTSKWDFFPNGIDKEFLNLKVKGGERDKKVVIYAGNIGPAQNLELVIPPLAKKFSKELEFWIAGDGKSMRSLENLVLSENLNNINLLGPLSRNALIQKYTESDILFLHLKDSQVYEKVIPSKIFEYGALGIPILAGVQGYTRKFILENLNNCKVFEPDNYNDCIEKMDKLLKLLPVEIDSTEFINKFDRRKIMENMAEKLFSLSNF